MICFPYLLNIHGLRQGFSSCIYVQVYCGIIIIIVFDTHSIYDVRKNDIFRHKPWGMNVVIITSKRQKSPRICQVPLLCVRVYIYFIYLDYLGPLLLHKGRCCRVTTTWQYYIPRFNSSETSSCWPPPPRHWPWVLNTIYNIIIQTYIYIYTRSPVYREGRGASYVN